MDRQEMISACVIGHLHCLLRRAMRTLPRLVGTDRHDRQIVWGFAAKRTKCVRHGGVTAENNSPPVPLDHIAVVTAVAIVLPASAPMIDFERRYLHVSISRRERGAI